MRLEERVSEKEGILILHTAKCDKLLSHASVITSSHGVSRLIRFIESFAIMCKRTVSLKETSPKMTSKLNIVPKFHEEVSYYRFRCIFTSFMIPRSFRKYAKAKHENEGVKTKTFPFFHFAPFRFHIS